MSIHLHREMELLSRSAVTLCAHVEQNVRDAVHAFLERDSVLAKKVVEADQLVDAMETDLSENCLKTLALHQPLAGDLRFIFSLAKIAGILERIGDLAGNLAKKGRALARMEVVAVPVEVVEMAEHARKMLKDSIDSLVEEDTAKALGVITADNEINARKRVVRKMTEAAIMANPAMCPQWLAINAASRNIERMGDMTANIATEVIYSVEGKSIRHGLDCE